MLLFWVYALSIWRQKLSLIRDYIRALISSFPDDSAEILVNNVPIRAEIVRTPEKIQKGLMYRDSLGENCGMLFIFPDSQPRSFWMRNTKIPLSIAYTDANGYIINIEEMCPYSEQQVLSRGPASCALEMNRGWFKKNGIKPGHKIKRVIK